ncbi:speriolin-like protein [Chiloscyllium plagiosum]|uniref:speriolin-like protein n=1 Tax=Chiloscyllium plagiosum TaxID=36176 RepID=UPI001CB7FB4B|nr:speriolin-like protein [Chiloscyllium plagiosum]
MDPEDQIRRDFDDLVSRGRNRTCKRRRDQQNDPYFVDIDFVEDGTGGGGAAAAPIPQDEEYWTSSFMEDPNVIAQPPAPPAAPPVCQAVPPPPPPPVCPHVPPPLVCQAVPPPPPVCPHVPNTSVCPHVPPSATPAPPVCPHVPPPPPPLPPAPPVYQHVPPPPAPPIFQHVPPPAPAPPVCPPAPAPPVCLPAPLPTVDPPDVCLPATAPPQVCAPPIVNAMQNGSDGAGAAGPPCMPVVRRKERAPSALKNVRVASAIQSITERAPAALSNRIASAVPSGIAPKRQKTTCLRRNVSAHGPPQQRPKKIQRSLNFDIPCGAPGGSRVPDNPAGDRAASGRRNDVQAVAVHERAKEKESAHHILGEIAFQLDRRILTHVFTDQFRLYGFRVSDISEKITEVAGISGRCDEMNARSTEIMNNLRNFGYCPDNHATFAEFIVNRFGILKEKPQGQTTLENYNNRAYLQKLVTDNTPPPLLKDMLVLLTSLWNLSAADGKPMFIW